MIKGTYVTLKVMDSKDIEMVRCWKNSPENYEFFANRDFISDFRQNNWFEKKNKADNNLLLIIFNNNNMKPIGMTLLEDIDHRNRTACWGIYIAETEYRKRIFAVEAVYLLFNYGFDYLNLRKIYGNTLGNNLRGRKFHGSVGFREEAIFLKHIYIDGEYQDLIWICLFDEDWKIKRHEIARFITEFNNR